MKEILCQKKPSSPSKVVCIGRNYVEHIAELGNEMPSEPVIFIKPNSAIATDMSFTGNDDIHYEAEISFIIKDNAPYAVGFGLDMTKRDVQSALKKKGLPWERAKSFDGSAIFSNFVEFTGNSQDLRLELFINDILIQEGGCELMLYKPQAIIDEVLSFMSFEDGDILMTGTPKGVGVVNSGDSFTGKVYDKNQLLIECNWVAQTI